MVQIKINMEPKDPEEAPEELEKLKTAADIAAEIKDRNRKLDVIVHDYIVDMDRYVWVNSCFLVLFLDIWIKMMIEMVSERGSFWKRFTLYVETFIFFASFILLVLYIWAVYSDQKRGRALLQKDIDPKDPESVRKHRFSYTLEELDEWEEYMVQLNKRRNFKYQACYHRFMILIALMFMLPAWYFFNAMLVDSPLSVFNYFDTVNTTMNIL
ncbi:hypothetical protein GCK72_008944 [Caenorhabditis remanei]|uniref:Uncharacterized protein n=1 Tax=Caenorhabditis remanei TaxID=31234 RepID=A0A6A5H1A8_CAERE|nr:hypothetical protein GCK72_008944 [Caenorhabditis remanei]KAF1760695.1 hypothetical protein GCK72_008944 [Caenorhabditis remanei]